MFHRAELKKRSKEAMQGNWSQTLLILGLLTIVYGSIDIASYFDKYLGNLSLLFQGPVMISFFAFMLHLYRQGTASVNKFYESFSNFNKWMLAGLWQNLWAFLWTLLLIVPGIIKGFSYSQYYFILADNPDANLREALKTSIKMTHGYKSELFVTYLSFINWVLAILAVFFVICFFIPQEPICSVVCWIATALICLYFVPYVAGTYVGIYEYLKEQAISKGVCDPAEFGLEVQQQSIEVTTDDTSILTDNQVEISSAQTLIEQADIKASQEIIDNLDEHDVKVSLEKR